jgi:hypothetical protein
MTAIPLAIGDYNRRVAAEPYIALRNRFCEENPTLNDQPVAVISRPALKKFIEVGSGPIRKTFSEPGVFGGDLFVVSDDLLYRVSADDGSATYLGNISNTGGDVSMAATAPIGAELAHLFIANGGVLWLYMESPAATATLTGTAAANNDVVLINTTYYKFTTGSVDTGTPAGTVGSPWLVFSTGTFATDLETLGKAVNASGVAGTDYSTALVAHTTVTAGTATATTLPITALAEGPAGNAYPTTETGANLNWSNGATMTGGGSVAPLSQVTMPDDVGAICVAHINSYVIVVPVQTEALDTVGKFFWIQPGEITVDGADFATAERAPDKLHQVVVFGDMFWLLGQKTTEPWVTTGDTAAPMQRFTGILFDRGSWEGTAVQVKDSLIVVDEDGGVFQIGGGQVRISRPDIEERIRRAIQTQAVAEA